MPNASSCLCPSTSAGIIHKPDCWMASKAPASPPMFAYCDPNASRIAAALERIAVALERKS